ncbi:BOS complex subunit ncln-like [Liolophura sinensis]|uniref:BOS complex subunit ncln-like n=1 Tax=Liolophura sinensis TaxID=3198878 RepID=UPI003158CE7F
MLFDEAGEVLEMFRNSFPLSFLFFVPLLIIISPMNPVQGAHEFGVYRMQQYDLHGTAYGCRNAMVNMEARSLEAKMLTRRCVIARLREINMVKYRDLLTQNAGALLILLPQNVSTLAAEEKELLMGLERDLMSEETPLPVYFTHESAEVGQMYEEVKRASTSDQAATAVEALLGSALANGYQLVVNGAQAKSMADFQIVNIQGKLSGYGIEDQLPTVAIIAHYDSYGVAPALSRGADSNGSGVVMLLELARLFSKLYTNSRTHAKYNLVFLLSGGGKFNYQGTKKWIEDNLDSPDSNILGDVLFVLCLDSLGQGNTLNLHVSKPPKEDSAGGIFQKNLEDVISEYHPEVQFKMTHKKINLAEESLAWEHERFSMRRLPAFSLSRLDTHRSPLRSTILDTRDQVDVTVVKRNTYIVAEALARYIYNLSSQGSFQLFGEGLTVEESLMEAWLDELTRQPRACQLLPKDHSLVQTLTETLMRYLKDVKTAGLKADKRDPEFMFYSGAQFMMNSYSVKPAVFDLFLALGILGYLGIMYLLVQNFYIVLGALNKISSPKKSKVQ